MNMMRRGGFQILILVLTLFSMNGCIATRQVPPFQPLDLQPQVDDGRITPKLGGFLVVLDASASMAQRYRGISRVDHAVAFLDHLNRTLPEMPIQAGIRVLGATGEPLGLRSRRVYGMTTYRRSDVDAIIQEMSRTGGHSPLGEALSDTGVDLAGVAGQVALILVTDGDALGTSALKAARDIKDRLGDRLCIHSVQIGDAGKGQNLLAEIVEAGGCGLAVHADWLFHPADMADYVKLVFYDNHPEAYDSDRDGVSDGVDECPGSPLGDAVDDSGCPLDSDGDGVPDDVDHCPGTPTWIVADMTGCPPDSDGDGVKDDLDQCEETPLGARVDGRGCWVLSDVQFDTAAAIIKPEFARRLNDVVAVLKANPTVHVEIQGHTDNTGSAAVNQSLSKDRASAVVAYLVSRGVDAGRLSFRGLGETRPVAVNDTPEGRGLNRRVEILPQR